MKGIPFTNKMRIGGEKRRRNVVERSITSENCKFVLLLSFVDKDCFIISRMVVDWKTHRPFYWAKGEENLHRNRKKKIPNSQVNQTRIQL